LPYDKVTQFQSFGKRHILTLSSSGLPISLEIEGQHFIDHYKSYAPPENHFADAHHFFSKFGKKGLFLAIGFLVGFIAFTYFVLIPSAVSLVTTVFPKSYEIEMGKSIYNEYITNFDVDSTKTAHINAFYSSLKVETGYPIHITVVNQPVMNAFALPGGEIVVFSGILDSMKNYNELIGLLGHEVGHVEKRHSLKMLIKNLSNYALISLVFQDYSGTLAVVVENAATIEQYSYSRNAESESDEFGYATVTLNKGDPEYMANMFERMMNENGVGNEIPAFLQTHPKLKERVEVIKAKLKEDNLVSTHQERLQHLFLQARDGLTLD